MAALQVSGLSPVEKLTLMTLASHANESGECWPGIDRLKTLTGLGRSSVLRSLATLERAGLVAITRQTGIPNRYRLNLNQYHSDTATSTTVTPVSTPTSTTVEPLPVPQWNGGSTTVEPEQTNNKPIEQTKNVYTRDAIREYESPEDDGERWQYITAISGVVKETVWEKTQELFENAAETLMRDGVTIVQVEAFGDWWRQNSYYQDSGKASLTTFMQEIRNSIAGVTTRPKPNPNGQHKKVNPDVDERPERVGGVF